MTRGESFFAFHLNALKSVDWLKEGNRWQFLSLETWDFSLIEMKSLRNVRENLSESTWKTIVYTFSWMKRQQVVGNLDSQERKPWKLSKNPREAKRTLLRTGRHVKCLVWRCDWYKQHELGFGSLRIAEKQSKRKKIVIRDRKRAANSSSIRLRSVGRKKGWNQD